MKEARRVRSFRAVTAGAGLVLALSTASFGQQPPPPVAVTRPVAWLISRGPTEIQVLIRDLSRNETSFRIERRRTNLDPWALVTDINLPQLMNQTGAELPFTDQHLTADTEYQYRVRAGRAIAPNPTQWSSAVLVTGRTRPVTAPSAASSCTSLTTATCDATFEPSTGRDLLYYRSHSLATHHASITRVVLVVHGMGRDAQRAYNSMIAATDAASVRGETLVVAPLFGADDWTESWKAGGESHDGLSSFAAADELILAMTDPENFPNVRDVVVAGHSAGGQFTQRYAATSSIESLRPGLRFRYVVANPSSYVYLNDQRPVGSDVDQVVVTFGTRAGWCSTYNEYRYGLEDRNAYASRLTADEIRLQYPGRYVVYLLGQDDISRDDETLDEGCEAMTQGTQRLVRGRFYFRHMMQFFGWNRHRRLEVPDVGHNSADMYVSQNGQEALFF